MIAPVPSHTTATPAATTRTWVPVSDQEDMVLGQRYRLTMTVRAPYTVANIQKLEDALRLKVGVENLAESLLLKRSITIEGFQASYPSGQTGGTPTWKFTMTFVKTGGGTPLFVIIGAVALIATLAILCAVVGHTVEKEGTKIGGLIGDAKDAAVSTVFNPFFLIAAVIVVLAVKGRSLKSIRG